MSAQIQNESQAFQNIDAMVQSWYSKNREKIESKFSEKIGNYIPNQEILEGMICTVIHYTFKELYVCETKMLMPAWKINADQLYPLCDFAFFNYIDKIKEQFRRADSIVATYTEFKNLKSSDIEAMSRVLYKHILDQMFVVLKLAPSKIYTYYLSEKMAENILDEILNIIVK